MIDLERLEALLKGDDIPDNLGEEMFLASYAMAADGEKFFTHLLNLGDVLDKLNINELQLLILGYAMGQYDRESNDFALAVFDDEDNGNQTTH